MRARMDSYSLRQDSRDDWRLEREVKVFEMRDVEG